MRVDSGPGKERKSGTPALLVILPSMQQEIIPAISSIKGIARGLCISSKSIRIDLARISVLDAVGVAVTVR
jgi:hypothetical protein